MNDLKIYPIPPDTAVQVTPLSQQEVACDHCAMFGLCEEAGLSRDRLLLDQVVSRRTALARTTELFQKDAPFHDLYAVKSGALAAVGEDDKGKRKVFGFYFPGDILGLDAINSGYYQNTVVALEKSSVCRLHYESASLLGEHQAGFYQQLIQAMSHRLNCERWSSQLLAAQSSEQRLAAFVVYLSSQLRARGLPYREFRLPMTRCDIADYLGMAMETVSRVLRGLQKKGILVLKGRSTHINDMEALMASANLSNPGIRACQWVSS